MAVQRANDGTPDGLILRLPLPKMPGANSRTHWSVRHRAAKQDRYIAATLALAQVRGFKAWEPMQGAALTVTWHGRGRLPDPDNIGGRTKAFIDGLTDAGVWKDDAVVRSITFRTERSKDPGVTIEIVRA